MAQMTFTQEQVQIKRRKDENGKYEYGVTFADVEVGSIVRNEGVWQSKTLAYNGDILDIREASDLEEVKSAAVSAIEDNFEAIASFYFEDNFDAAALGLSNVATPEPTDESDDSQDFGPTDEEVDQAIAEGALVEPTDEELAASDDFANAEGPAGDDAPVGDDSTPSDESTEDDSTPEIDNSVEVLFRRRMNDDTGKQEYDAFLSGVLVGCVFRSTESPKSWAAHSFGSNGNIIVLDIDKDAKIDDAKEAASIAARNNFSLGSYDEAIAKVEAEAEAAALAKAEQKAASKAQPGPCLCGCGDMTKPRSKFLSGHDAKLKSVLNRLGEGEVEDGLEVPEVLLARIEKEPTFEVVGFTPDRILELAGK